MNSLTPTQQELVTALVNSAPSDEPLDLAITLIMNTQPCTQIEAVAILRDLRPAIAATSAVPFTRTELRGRVPQESWKFMATGS